MQKRIRLKLFRVENDLTQQQLADILKIDVSYYNQIETSKRAGSEKIWQRLAEHFKLDEKKLYTLRYNETI